MESNFIRSNWRLQLQKPREIRESGKSRFRKRVEWSEEEWKLYNEAACVLVEPNAYIGRYDADEEMEYYYNQCDQNGFGFVKGQIDPVENSENWRKVCDLVETMGY